MNDARIKFERPDPAEVDAAMNARGLRKDRSFQILVAEVRATRELEEHFAIEQEAAARDSETEMQTALAEIERLRARVAELEAAQNVERRLGRPPGVRERRHYRRKQR